MPNPVPARYTVQLGPTFTPEVAGELAAWGEVLGHSTSEITRWCTEAGLELLRADFRGRLRDQAGVSELPPSVLLSHVEAAQERGERQVKRRREYDDRTRNTTDKQAGVKRRRAPRKAA